MFGDIAPVAKDMVVDFRAGRSKRETLSRREKVKEASDVGVVKREKAGRAKDLDTKVESLMRCKATQETRPRVEICGRSAGKRLYITTLFVDQLPTWQDMVQDVKPRS